MRYQKYGVKSRFKKYSTVGIDKIYWSVWYSSLRPNNHMSLILNLFIYTFTTNKLWRHLQFEVLQLYFFLNFCLCREDLPKCVQILNSCQNVVCLVNLHIKIQTSRISWKLHDVAILDLHFHSVNSWWNWTAGVLQSNTNSPVCLCPHHSLLSLTQRPRVIIYHWVCCCFSSWEVRW